MSAAREEAVKKGLQDQILVMAALSSLEAGSSLAANWRMMWAYWTGDDPSGAPWARPTVRTTASSATTIRCETQ